MIRARTVICLSLLFTTAFFIEYTPLYRVVHIPYDLEGYHFPLDDYAYQALRHGRFPQWDAANYCGFSFVGNIQAGLFYPPAWLMFLLSLPAQKLHYQALQDLVLAHVWLAFLLCFFWLNRQKRLHWLASALGAAIFAFGGYMLLQLQHLGLVCGYTWIPLGFWAIDQAEERKSWRPLWKLALASAMCLLAGYPPTWVVFAVCMIAYAGGRRRGLRWATLAACALAVSLVWSSMQLLPALEATHSRNPEAKYNRDSGIKQPEFYLSYFIPNYFNFNLDVDPQSRPGREYLYLGGIGIAGLALFLMRRRIRDAVPLICVLFASLLFLVNPFGVAGIVVEQSAMLAQVFTDWYFLAGVAAALAPLAAFGLDFAFTRVSTRAALPRALATVLIALACLWSIRLLIVWNKTIAIRNFSGFATGWWSGIDALIDVILCAGLIFLYIRSRGRTRAFVTAGLLLVVASEFKAFGTSRRINATRGGGPNYINTPMVGMNVETYRLLRLHNDYRLALDDTGPNASDLHHVGLSTPQGFDPFLPLHYKTLIDALGGFRTNREFDLSPDNENALRLLGVGYFVSSEQAEFFGKLRNNPHFRLLPPNDSYYKVFEFLNADPAFGWDNADANGWARAQTRVWEPETRVLQVRSPAGGVFRLSEQFYPGWTAAVDGARVTITRCQEAFQCIEVPPGEHTVKFHYRCRPLIWGSLLSMISVLAAIAVLQRAK